MSKTKDEKANGDPKRTKLPADHVVKAKEMHTIRYAFTDDELKEKSKRMAEAANNKTKIQNDLKTVKSEYKAKIDAEDALIANMANQISNGYESRNVECEVEKDFEKGVKTYTYQGVKYDTVPLTNFDRQTELNLLNNAPKANGVEPSPAEAEKDED